jgi:hypothetical protein
MYTLYDQRTFSSLYRDLTDARDLGYTEPEIEENFSSF